MCSCDWSSDVCSSDLQTHGQQHGYALTIKRSIPSLQQVCYSCDRGSYQIRRSKPLAYMPDDQRKRKRFVSQTQCQYEVYIRFSKRRVAWLVTESQSHNHEPSLSAAVHAVHRRLQPEEKTHLIELATSNCGLTRSQISRLLKEKNPENISVMKDISNAIATAKRDQLNGLTNIESAVERLRNLNWQYKLKEDSISGAVTDLIFTPPEGLQLLQRSPSVIFLDCTYKLIR